MWLALVLRQEYVHISADETKIWISMHTSLREENRFLQGALLFVPYGQYGYSRVYPKWKFGYYCIPSYKYFVLTFNPLFSLNICWNILVLIPPEVVTLPGFSCQLEFRPKSENSTSSDPEKRSSLKAYKFLLAQKVYGTVVRIWTFFRIKGLWDSCSILQIFVESTVSGTVQSTFLTKKQNLGKVCCLDDGFFCTSVKFRQKFRRIHYKIIPKF